jgi:hypothetical protein
MPPIQKNSSDPFYKVAGIACLMLAATPASALDLRLVARLGGAAPGADGDFISFTSPVLNNNGDVAFDGTFGPNGGPYIHGIFSEGDGDGQLRLVAQVGDVAPAASGKSFTDFEQPERNLYLNDLGDVAFAARVTGFLPGLFTDRERFFGNPLTKIALAGEPAADAAGGRTFT